MKRRKKLRNHAKNSSEKWMWLRLLEIDKELHESKTD